MFLSRLTAVLVATLVTGCAIPGNSQVEVTGAGPNDLLKLRSGPSLEFNIIMGLPDGTLLNQSRCVTEVGQRWCEVSLADAPAVTGYVSADYLTEVQR